MENKSENENGEEEEVVMSGLLALPEDCIAAIISLTSPRDACSLACVSTTCRSAADSDSIWNNFLSPQYVSAISTSLSKKKLYFRACHNQVLINDGKLKIKNRKKKEWKKKTKKGRWSLHLGQLPVSSGRSGNASSTSLSKKKLYFQACHNPILINDGKLSFWLDKPSGKKCYMISPRELKIVWGDTPIFYEWISLADARFPKVAKLIDVCWFEIHGEISTLLLSPRTTYVAYLVFKPFDECYGFQHNPVEVTVGLAGNDDQKRTIYLDTEEQQDIVQRHRRQFHCRQVCLPADDHESFPKKREDGWFESELGEHFYGGDEDGELSVTIMEVKRGNWKSGLVFQGIEIRPKKE